MNYLKGSYGLIPPCGAQKNKANLFRIECCVMRIAKRNLKKQSQFQMEVNKCNYLIYRVLWEY